MIETLRAPARARARRSYWRLRALKGIGYATPVAVMVAVFFVLPLGLVFWMSANRWRLLGSPTLNFPDNYTRIPENQLFLDSIVFTLKYTAIVTVVLSAVAMGLALLVQEERRGTGFLPTVYFLPGAVGFAAAGLLFYGFYAPTSTRCSRHSAMSWLVAVEVLEPGLSVQRARASVGVGPA